MQDWEDEAEQVEDLVDIDDQVLKGGQPKFDEAQQIDELDGEKEPITQSKHSDEENPQNTYTCFCNKSLWTKSSFEYHVKKHHTKFYNSNENFMEDNLVRIPNNDPKMSTFQLYEKRVLPTTTKVKNKAAKGSPRPAKKTAPARGRGTPSQGSQSSAQGRLTEKVSEGRTESVKSQKQSIQKQPQKKINRPPTVNLKDVEDKTKRLQDLKKQEKRLLTELQRLDKDIAEHNRVIKKYEQMIEGFKMIIKTMNLKELIGKDIDI